MKTCLKCLLPCSELTTTRRICCSCAKINERAHNRPGSAVGTQHIIRKAIEAGQGNH